MDGQTLFRPLLLVTVVAGCAAPQWTAHQDPRGFSLELPRGWKASSAGAAGTRPWGWKTSSIR